MPRQRRHPISPEIVAVIEADRAREARRRDAYGEVRPIIHTDFQGHKFVAVGDSLHWSRNWKTVPDFLGDYIKAVLGKEWGNAELVKPQTERHPILQWYGALCRLQQRTKERTPGGQDGIYESELDGPSRAYLLLAYDLYVLRDNLRLQESLVRRLKHRDQFQGARYELFVAATMIRAGFDVEYEDERDSTQKHPEFRATDKRTKQVIAVEAKSRHRPGVLGRPGVVESARDFRLGLRGLLEAALEKPVEHPYVIFIDANMPPEIASPLSLVGWRQEVEKAVRLVDIGITGAGLYAGSGFALLVVTNTPDYYGREAGRVPGDLFYAVRPAVSARPLEHPEVIDRVEQALKQYGNIPMAFPAPVSVAGLGNPG